MAPTTVLVARLLRSLRGRSATIIVAALLMAASAARVEAMDIQRVISPGGVEAWLVESREVPLIAVQFGFVGGTVQDPPGKEGLVKMLAAMLEEGAGDMDATAFQERLEEAGVRLSFNASRDALTGSLQTLSANAAEGFELLRLALSEPRFDAQALERVRGQMLARLKIDENDPSKVASREWYKLAFGGHPYSRPPDGTPESVASITAEDLRGMARRLLARDVLKVSVVGDIDAAALGGVLDQVFGRLPAKADLMEVAEAEPPIGPLRKVIPMDVPQSVALFGHRGPKRKDPDFLACYVLNYIVGGGGFSSRLMEEVREKRGLAYSVYSYLSPLRHGAIYLGNVATENRSVGRSLDVIRAELQRMAVEGPTEEELQHAKQYLTGSYPLRFDTSAKIASQLLWIQIEDLGIDYVDKRNAMIEAITLEDIRRAAQAFLRGDALIVTIVGDADQIEGGAG